MKMKQKKMKMNNFTILSIPVISGYLKNKWTYDLFCRSTAKKLKKWCE
jgi:hypothetical protein